MEESVLKSIYNAKKYYISKSGEPKRTIGFKDKKIDDFLKWFNKSIFDKGCYYCGTTNEKSEELFNLRPKATRGGKRGKRLELDRIDPFLPYDNLDNLVWCCYWCNNAKSNFFTESEFKNIGKAIGVTLINITNNTYSHNLVK